jgi:hypothetical protein
MCKCDECWVRFQASPEFPSWLDLAQDKHAMDLGGFSGPGLERELKTYRAEDWPGLPHARA